MINDTLTGETIRVEPFYVGQQRTQAREKNGLNYKGARRASRALPAFEGENRSLIHGLTGNNVLNGTHEAIHPNGVPALAHIDGLAFEVNLGTFLHVNTPQTWPLYDLTLAWAEITPDDTFLDLYCGVGTLTLLGARKAKAALGIEVVESSIEAARENARRNELNHVTFEAGKVEVVLPKALREGFTPSVAIVDPAFKGMESSVITALSRVSPLKRLVYVSCNPKTFARDAALFIKAGWRLERLGAVDLFPGALHMEAIGRFTRD